LKNRINQYFNLFYHIEDIKDFFVSIDKFSNYLIAFVRNFNIQKSKIFIINEFDIIDSLKIYLSKDKITNVD